MLLVELKAHLLHEANGVLLPEEAVFSFEMGESVYFSSHHLPLNDSSLFECTETDEDDDDDVNSLN